MYTLVDFKSRELVAPDGLVFSGIDSPWEVVMDMTLIKEKINKDYFATKPPCLAKYLPFMPIKNPSKFVSLGESATPLVKSKNIGKKLGMNLYFKIEGKNPTGSFKDRGSAVDITVAKEFKAKGIVLASTGNMAASCSCYAAAAKVPCFVIVPEGVPISKLAQVISFGGKIIQVKGSYNDAADLAYSIAKDMGFYLAGDYAFRVEGQKTAAFEVIDQLFFREPDAVIVPIGCGTNIAAYAKGFNEYIQLDLIAKSPKLIGVQATGASAVVNSYKANSLTLNRLEKCDTIASAIAVPEPIDGSKALAAIKNTDGEAYAVTDKEILEAQYCLSTDEGLFVESASASTLAYLIKEYRKFKGRTVVCILTGDGLKDPNTIIKSAIKPPTIYPEIEEFKKLYQSNFFENKTMFFVESGKVLFHSTPSIIALETELKELFGSSYEREQLLKIRDSTNSFLKKGKKVTAADLQDIVQSALESIEKKSGNTTFSIIDFEVRTEKDKPPSANVTVAIDNKQFQGESDGVGPVDAVINALCKACQEKVNFELTTYKVDIRSQGVDAVVNVELTLVKDNLSSLGSATSPDIIQASLEAFEDSYNGFYNMRTSL